MASLSTLAPAEHAAVAVAGVLAAADVGQEQQVRVPRAQPPERPLDDAVLGEVLRPDLVLGRGQAEQDDRGDAERADPVHLPVERLVDRQVADPGHRGDLALDPGAVDHEERLDEVPGLELVLAHEPAEGVGASPAPRTMDLGGGHGRKTREPTAIAATTAGRPFGAVGTAFAASRLVAGVTPYYSF